MKTEKRKRLEEAGWKFGSTKDFLNLTPEEEAYLELKLALADKLEACRKAKHMTQKQLADRLKSSQPRIALMEKGDPTVSIDLIIKALFTLGTTRRELAKAI